MKSEPGTYALLLESNLSGEIQIGRWGRLRVVPGYYVYVGSAFGPGGVRARVARHLRKSKRIHWHIDYLRDAVDPVRAWCSYSHVRLEHEWARSLGQMAGVACVARFGCSDCSCDTHLFACSRRAIESEIPRVIGGVHETWMSPEMVAVERG